MNSSVAIGDADQSIINISSTNSVTTGSKAYSYGPWVSNDLDYEKAGGSLKLSGKSVNIHSEGVGGVYGAIVASRDLTPVEDLTKDLTSDDVTSDQAKELLGNVAAEGVETTMKVDEGMYNEGFIIDGEAKVHSTGPNSVMQSTLELATIAPLALNRILTNDVHKRMGDIRSMHQTSGA